VIVQSIIHKLQEYSCGLFLVLLLLGGFLFFASPTLLHAQENSLDRISSAERSDGKGHVLRFHMSQPVDSFDVFQPGVDLIQMTMYGNQIDTTDISLPDQSPIFDEISFYDIPKGIGVDIYITKDKYFKSRAYHDGNTDDLLLALTNTNKIDLKHITKDLEPLIWSRLTMDAESLLVTNQNVDTTKTASENTNYNQSKDKLKFDVVVLDPGHGGHDPGSIGYKNVKEKHVVLEIAKKVGGYINEYLPDVKVIYTRDDDTFIDLEKRGSIANEAEGDLFISFHCNSFSSRQPRGTELYFLGMERSESALEVMKRENKVVLPNNDTRQKKLSQEELLIYELANSAYMASSEHIAGMMEQQLDDRANRHSRGVKQARFVVLYHASMPAVLIETGFISNPSET